MKTNQTRVVTAEESAALGVSNWIGTMGVGKYSLDARPVKSVKMAEAWVRKISVSYPNESWVIFPVSDYKGELLGYGASAV